MQIELFCNSCSHRFTAPADAPGAEVLERMMITVPNSALGDGETFEDMIHTALAEQAPMPCPDCGDPLQVCEESLGELAMTMLAQM